MSVILFTGGEVPGQVPPWAGTPPWQVPPGQIPTEQVDPQAGTPRQVHPLAGTPCHGQVHYPPGQVHPQADTPSWAGTPPGQVHPLGRYTPGQVHPPCRYTPQQCIWDMVNKRAVCILLECILVLHLHEYTSINNTFQQKVDLLHKHYPINTSLLPAYVGR